MKTKALLLTLLLISGCAGTGHRMSPETSRALMNLGTAIYLNSQPRPLADPAPYYAPPIIVQPRYIAPYIPYTPPPRPQIPLYRPW